MLKAEPVKARFCCPACGWQGGKLRCPSCSYSKLLKALCPECGRRVNSRTGHCECCGWGK